MTTTHPLCDLHLHLFGCIPGPVLLERLIARPKIDWASYEASFQSAFGYSSPARALVERARDGHPISVDEFQDIFEFGEDDAGNFARFSAKFGLLLLSSSLPDALVGRAPWKRVIEEACAVGKMVTDFQRGQGLSYVEQRLRPGPLVAPEMACDIWSNVLKTFEKAPPGFIARLAPSLPREDPMSQWTVVKKLALGPHGEGLTGIDFCHIEEGYPPKSLTHFFADFRAFNQAHPERALALLYHVGESFTDKSIESAIRWVQEAAEAGAHRLGHAIALGIHPDHFGIHTRQESVAERLDQIDYDLKNASGLSTEGVQIDRRGLLNEQRLLRQREPNEHIDCVYDAQRLAELVGRQNFAMDAIEKTGSIIEVCPTSNRRIGGLLDDAHHPVHRFHERGIPFVVASDDPGILNVDLVHEIDWVVQQCGMTSDERNTLIARAWQSRSEVLSGRSGA